MQRGADAVVLLERLVAFPTIAGGPNLDLINFVAERLAAAGANVRVIPTTRPNACNLHAVFGPPAVPGVLLAAHSDVVATEGQPWTHDPFTLRQDHGRLSGRGTADMKGFLAAVLAAVVGSGVQALVRPLHIALSSDEELGCRGVGPLLDALTPFAIEYCIVGEPTQMDVAVAHKGKVVMRVDVRGQAGHSSLPSAGVNAVQYAARLIGAIAGHQKELIASASPSQFAVPHPTLNVGTIRGGVSVNTVPDRCQFEFELRTLPGQDPHDLMAPIAEHARALEREMRTEASDCSITFAHQTGYPPLSPGHDGGISASVAALSGGKPGLAVDFGTEAGLYHERLGVPVVICGPGSMKQAHRADEYLEVAQLRAAERFVARLLAQLAKPASDTLGDQTTSVRTSAEYGDAV